MIKVITILLVVVMCAFGQQLPTYETLPPPPGIIVPSYQTQKQMRYDIRTNTNPQVYQIQKQHAADDIQDQPIPVEFWVFLGLFTALIFLVIRKNMKNAANQTVIVRRSDMAPQNLSAQINYHESEIARLTTLLKYYQATQQMSQPGQPGRIHHDYPARYQNSMELEMSEHPRYM